MLLLLLLNKNCQDMLEVIKEYFYPHKRNITNSNNNNLYLKRVTPITIKEFSPVALSLVSLVADF